MRSVAHVGDEQLPYARSAQGAHREKTPVPRVEVADEPYASRRGCPHRERDALDALHHPAARAEDIVQSAMPPLADQMEV
jgi:hypothetical protein